MAVHVIQLSRTAVLWISNLLKVCVLNAYACTIHTFNVRCVEIIYSVKCGLWVRTDVQDNAIKYTCKFNQMKKFKFSSLGFIEMGYKYLVCFSIILAALFDMIWHMH